MSRRRSSALWTGDARVKPPFGSVRVDRGHPLGQGLEFCVLANEAGGVLHDLVSGRRSTFNDAPTWTTSPQGIMLDLDGTDYAEFADIPDAPFLGALTLVYRGTVDTGGAFRHFAGKHAGNGASANPFDFRTEDQASPEMTLVRANTDFHRFGGPTITTTEFHQYAVVAPGVIESAPTFYIDLTATTGIERAGTGTGAPTGSGAAIRLGRRADGAVQQDGQCHAFYAYSRALTAGEIAWLHAEPYAMLRPVVRRQYFVAAPGAGQPYLRRRLLLGVGA